MNKILIYLLHLAMPVLYATPTVQDTIATEKKEVITVAQDSTLVTTEYTFTEGFKNNYTDDAFQYEPKTKAKNDWDRFWESVAEFFDSLFKTGEKSESSGIGTFLTYFIAGAIVLFAVYMIARAVLNEGGGWIFGKSAKKIIVQDIDGEDIHEMDFPSLIETTIGNEDYRLAIRYYYLWLLKRLSEREIIEWHYDKTNSEYAYEIKNTDLREKFQYLSYVYDYSWYGEFPINENAFTKVRKVFRETLNTL
ncbi:DUF4129 domain-containing protein [Flavobacterium litorale]|uniref:DUF4129 domain-containing protein n=1 Tax=Flavobacterium litorale TaxID=2856519 RepID=A0ABX8V8W7_9FLAO|nr:DUF4129 domain-containing protein [Flavobacterium litorale]QYJ67476.1 DUF4129 domain-containing protein [Flavobacterium litorale]